MLLKLLAHGLRRKDKIRYVQSFIYTATHRDTHIHIHSTELHKTQSYTFTITHIHSYTQPHIFTVKHIRTVTETRT